MENYIKKPVRTHNKAFYTTHGITICEIKYTENPFVINKEYANQLNHKIEIFKKHTKTPKQIFCKNVAGIITGVGLLVFNSFFAQIFLRIVGCKANKLACLRKAHRDQFDVCICGLISGNLGVILTLGKMSPPQHVST